MGCGCVLGWVGEGVGVGWRAQENTYQIAHYALLCVPEEKKRGERSNECTQPSFQPDHLFAVFKEISAQQCSSIKDGVDLEQ